jgi:hypothetical protein
MTYTYLFTGNYINTYISILLKKLEKDGKWKEANKNEKQSFIDLLFFFHQKDKERYNHDYYHIQTNLQNILMVGNKNNIGIEIIADKQSLYKNMLTYYPKICNQHMAKTIEYTKNFTLEKDKVYIIKPVGKGASSGKGIGIVSNQKEWIDFENKKKDLKYDRYIISEYIQNPLLYDGKKFHFRIRFMITYIDNKPDYHPFTKYRIITAISNYKKSNYNNQKIHNTHIRSSDDIILSNKKIELEEQLKHLQITLHDFSKIKKQINLILKCAFEIAKPYIKSYPESKNAFENLGCDFMIDTNLNVYLLEINNHTTYRFKDDKAKDVINYRKYMAKLVYDKVIKKIFN